MRGPGELEIVAEFLSANFLANNNWATWLNICTTYEGTKIKQAVKIWRGSESLKIWFNSEYFVLQMYIVGLRDNGAHLVIFVVVILCQTLNKVYLLSEEASSRPLPHPTRPSPCSFFFQFRHGGMPSWFCSEQRRRILSSCGLKRLALSVYAVLQPLYWMRRTRHPYCCPLPILKDARAI